MGDTQAARAARLVASAICELTPINLHLDNEVATQIVKARTMCEDADLVGFCKEGDQVVLLFGEVKTSSDAGTPPNVMYGSGGMAWQLEEEATRLDIQHSLLKWLRARCEAPEHRELYMAAVERYVESLGKEILLVGILLRDTDPNELDVTSRAKALAQKLEAPTRIEIIAWYLPVPIKDWPALLHGGAP